MLQIKEDFERCNKFQASKGSIILNTLLLHILLLHILLLHILLLHILLLILGEKLSLYTSIDNANKVTIFATVSVQYFTSPSSSLLASQLKQGQFSSRKDCEFKDC